jgi:putative membrane protein
MSCCGAGMWMMWLWPILLVVLLVGGVIVARLLWTRVASDPHAPRGNRRSALDVLEERYARGEIDRDEFEQRRDALAAKRTRGRA